MRSKGIDAVERDYVKSPLTRKELVELIGSRDVAPFLNSRHEIYKKRGFKTKTPSKSEAISLILKEPNLLRRPLFVQGSKVVIGFNEDMARTLAP